MIKSFLPAVIFVGIAFTAFSQKTGYVITKDRYTQSRVESLDDTKIRVSGNVDEKILPADEVIEFFIPPRSFYGSITVDGTKRFGSKLAGGDISLFQYGKRFFIRKNEVELELTSANYMDVLKSTLGCNDLPFVAFAKNSLKSLITQFNESGCSIKDVPYFKVGAHASFQHINLAATMSEVWQSDIVSNGSAVGLGIFMDFPFYKAKAMSLSTELWWMKTPLKADKLNSDFRLVAMPVGLKCYVAGTKIGGRNARVFVKPGVVPAHLRYDLDKLGSNVHSLAFGFQGGTGIEVPLNGKLTLHSEVKYQRFLKSGGDFLQARFSTISLSMGISF